MNAAVETHMESMDCLINVIKSVQVMRLKCVVAV